MKTWLNKRWLWCLTVGLGCFPAWAQGEEGGRKKSTAKAEASESAAEKPEAKATSRKYLGIAVSPLSDLVREQLRLERGIAIDAITPGSPAEKAGLKPRDILLQVGGKDVSEPEELVQILQAAGDQELAVLILRQGKERKFSVTPVAREIGPTELRPEEGREIADVLRKAFEQGQAGDVIRLGNSGVLRIHPGITLDAGVSCCRQCHAAKSDTRIHPGITLEAGVGTLAGDLPANMRVEVSKNGDEPTRIKVERDGKKWEVTDVKELPEDVCKMVEPFLSGGKLAFHLHRGGKENAEGKDDADGMMELGIVVDGLGDVPGGMERLKRWQKTLESLRRNWVRGEAAAAVEAPAAPADVAEQLEKIRAQQSEALQAHQEALDKLRKEVESLRKNIEGKKK